MHLLFLYDPSQVRFLSRIKLPVGSRLVIAFGYEGTAKQKYFDKIKGKYQIETIQFEDLDCLVNHEDTSKIAVELVNKIQPEGHLSVKIKTLSNMLAVNIHSALHQLRIIEKLVEQVKYESVIIFGCNSETFLFPERPDVKSLYYPELSRGLLIHMYLKDLGIKVVKIKLRSSLIVKTATIIRRGLLNIYKLAIIFNRVLSISRFKRASDNTQSENLVGILIRAQSEYWTAKPFIEELRRRGYDPVIIQDDLIKNPSARYTLDLNGEGYISIHSFIRLRSLLSIWITATKDFLCSPKYLENLEFNTSECEFQSLLLSNTIAPKWISASLHSLPEIAVFEYEIRRLIASRGIRCIVTMDMVDQWGGVIGEVGRDMNVRTLTIQNTVLDDIFYAEAVSTDYMVVNGAHTANILEKSNHAARNILDFGSPIFDDIYIRSVGHRKQSSNEKFIVIGTQPFVQEFDYNEELILDTVEVLEKNGVPLDVIIKPHPRERKEKYIELVRSRFRNSSIKVRVSESDNILDLAVDCKIFVSRTSTALQSFYLINKFCVSYLSNYSQAIRGRLDYLGEDGVIIANSRDQLEESIMLIIRGSYKQEKIFSERRARYIRRYIGSFDGTVSQKLVTLIDHLVAD